MKLCKRMYLCVKTGFGGVIDLKSPVFFKWIKQRLRIKTFFGTSENAVKSRIRIAIPVYVLVAIIRKRLNVDADLYRILQILSRTRFEKTPLFQLLAESPRPPALPNYLTN